LPTPGAFEREEQRREEQWLSRDLECNPPELEEPGGEAGQDEYHDADRRASAEPRREESEQEDGGEHEHRRESARDLGVRAGDPEDACEEVGVEGALVVTERPKEQWEKAAILVAEAGRDRISVKGQRRLVPVVSRRVRRRDPELERHGRKGRAESQEDGRPGHERVIRGCV